MKNNRRNPERRSSARLVKSFTFKLGFDGYDIQSNVINISSSGLLCYIEQNIPVMSKVELILVIPYCINEVPEEANVHVKGVIVRSEQDEKGYKVAIFFTDLSEKDRQVIQAYVNEHLDE